MAFKSLITQAEFDTLEASVKPNYQKRDDGKYKPVFEAVHDGDRVFEIGETTGLRSALESEKSNSKALAAKLHVYDGLDPVAARTGLRELEDLRASGSPEKVTERIKAARAELAAQHTTQLETVTTEKAQLEGALTKHLLDAAAVQAIVKAKGNPALLLPIVKSNSRVVRDAKGEYSVRVYDAAGNERLSKRQGAVNEPMSVEELVGDLRTQKDYMAAFEGSGATGSGASGRNQGSGRSTQDTSSLSASERLKLAHKEAG